MPDWKVVNMSEQYMPVINKEEIAPGVVVYKDVIPGYHQLIPYIEQIVGAGMANWVPVNIAGNEIDVMSFPYPKEFKDPNDFSVSFEERVSLVLAGFLGFVEQNYVNENDLPQKFHDKLGLMKYGVGTSFPLNSPINDASIIIMYFLNDDYSGSTFEFPNLGITYQPKANEAMIMPSAEGYEYSLSEITEGTKYAVISFLRMTETI